MKNKTKISICFGVSTTDGFTWDVQQNNLIGPTSKINWKLTNITCCLGKNRFQSKFNNGGDQTHYYPIASPLISISTEEKFKARELTFHNSLDAIRNHMDME